MSLVAPMALKRSHPDDVVVAVVACRTDGVEALTPDDVVVSCCCLCHRSCCRCCRSRC